MHVQWIACAHIHTHIGRPAKHTMAGHPGRSGLVIRNNTTGTTWMSSYRQKDKIKCDTLHGCVSP